MGLNLMDKKEKERVTEKAETEKEKEPAKETAA